MFEDTYNEGFSESIHLLKYLIKFCVCACLGTHMYREGIHSLYQNFQGICEPKNVWDGPVKNVGNKKLLFIWIEI